MKSLLIVFEGPDGCGKTTQIRNVAVALKIQGYRVSTTRQPGGTEAGQRIRAIVKDEKLFNQITPMARRLLFTADSLILNKALSEATVDVVLCDRCEGISNAAYGIAEGCSTDEVRAVEQLGAEHRVPIDRAFIFQVAPEIAWERTDHEDLADSDFDRFSLVNDAYQALTVTARETGFVKSLGGLTIPVTLIDGSTSIDSITVLVAAYIVSMLRDRS